MNNIEEQDNELIALESIYEDSFTCKARTETHSMEKVGGEFSIDLELPENFHLLYKLNNDAENTQHIIDHLPPIYMHFTYPDDYPSSKPPDYVLSCKWLNRSQLTVLCQQLDTIWIENEGSVIMFHWVQYLKDNSLSDLKITHQLDLSKVRLKRSDSNNSYSETSTNNEESLVCTALDKRTIQDIAPNTNLLRLLKDYNDDRKIKVFNSKTFECKVCFVEKIGLNCLQFWPCCHIYCKDCMKTYFLVQIKDGFFKFLRCPEDKCESEANPKQVQELVPQDVYEKWDEMLLNSTLSSMGDIQPCPRNHCQYPTTIEDGQGQCPSCKLVFCGLCRFGYHGIEPCRIQAGQGKNILEAYTKGDANIRAQLETKYGKKYLKKLEDEFLSMNYLNENSKPCPRCRAKIEKIDGCNKITCQHCTSYFCWICSKMLDKANPYAHFNNPKSDCYQKLFMGVDMDEDDEIDDWQFEFWG